MAAHIPGATHLFIYEFTNLQFTILVEGQESRVNEIYDLPIDYLLF